jgi:hypothetical protein
MKERSYSGVTRAHIGKLRSGLGKFGITIPEGDDVEVKGPFGVKMQVQYDEPTQNLNLAIIDKPIFVSHAQIWKIIESQAKDFIPK